MTSQEQIASAASAASASISIVSPEHLKQAFDWLAVIASLGTIGTSVLAFSIFFVNRKKFSAAMHLLLSFAFQTTLSEIKEKLERLNEYNCNEPSEAQEIRNILHEIVGQLRGNRKLLKPLEQLTLKIEELADSKKLSEPRKRSIVSELRENLKNIQVSDLEGGDLA